MQINLDSEMLKSVVSEAILAVTDLAEVAALVAQILSRHRFDLSDEKVTQAQIADALIAGGVEHRREVRLSQHDRPDFLLPASGLAIEVKLRAGRMDIWRQLVRYAAHEAVRGLMLIWWEPHLDGGRWQSEADVPIRPTHWMPLPKAPEVTP